MKDDSVVAISARTRTSESRSASRLSRTSLRAVTVERDSSKAGFVKGLPPVVKKGDPSAPSCLAANRAGIVCEKFTFF